MTLLRLSSQTTLDEVEFVRRLDAELRTAGASEVLRRCLELKELGRRDTAITYLEAAWAEYPHDAALAYELAVLIAARESDRARRLLRDALHLQPEFDNAFRALAMIALREGEFGEFAELLKWDEAGRRIHFNVKAELSQLFIYLRELPRTRVGVSLVDNALSFAVTPSDHALRSGFAMILGAIRSGTPFSMVRLGDGEGAMWRFTAAEEAANLAAYTGARDYFSHRWYGQPLSATWTHLDAIQARLEAQLGHADIIAAPGRDWAAHEIEAAHARTFMCCVNAARASAKSAQGALRQPTDFHYELVATGGLSEIIDAASKICLVTSHAEVADLVRERFPSLSAVDVVTVPPAASDVGVTGRVLGERIYERFEHILAQARERSSDTVFLVGAGYVGKLICLELKAAGYIALDIGSIFDMLLKFDTRPNFSLYDPDACIREGVRFGQVLAAA